MHFWVQNHTKDIQYPDPLSGQTTGINALMTALTGWLINQKLGLLPWRFRMPCTLYGAGLHDVGSSREDNHALELRVGTLCRCMKSKPISVIITRVNHCGEMNLHQLYVTCMRSLVGSHERCKVKLENGSYRDVNAIGLKFSTPGKNTWESTAPRGVYPLKWPALWMV